MKNYKIIASSSKGNCYLYRNIMVDCGVSFDSVTPFLKDIDYVFITHKHTDHVNFTTLEKMLKLNKNMHVFMNKSTFKKCKIINKRIIVINLDVTINLKKANAEIITYPVYHDVPNYGLFIKFEDYNVFHATDCGDVSHIKISDTIHFCCLEENYKEDMINDNMRKLDSKSWEFRHLARVKQTHLSDIQRNIWISDHKIIEDFKAHKSLRNNKEE